MAVATEIMDAVNMTEKTRNFVNIKVDYRSKEEKKSHDRNLRSSTLLLKDISPRFEIWQGKTTRAKETFSRCVLSRMEQFPNSHFTFWVLKNFTTLAIEQFMWKMGERISVKNRVFVLNVFQSLRKSRKSLSRFKQSRNFEDK